ncbi:metallophosphoesterase family protein [Sporomusa sp.]|uniref:purple acid phosphatase family protein n=1 Tax=Sporomusa sp. TaxID=2078658 RepID=UPI002B83C9AD|nr:metallophosphoesterase family protein [Sporomusa sp.]HWR44501.1 metallophosphoesterase family protein [Sporomusa sp.]
MILKSLNLFTKRNLLCAAAILCAVLLLLFWPPGLNILPRNITLTWTGMPATTQNITWQTGRYVSGSQVEYVETATKLPATLQPGSAEQVVTDRGVITVHSVQLTNLKPGTSYQYRVGNGLLWSSYHTFTTATAQAAPFQFLLFGDSQGNSYDVWQRTVQTAYERNRAAAFMVHLGDLVDIGLNYDQWDDWFQAGRGVIDTISVMPVMGNHETYTSEWKIAPPRLYTALFRLPDNGPPGLQGKVYSFDYGDAHFSILDSQLQEEAEWIPNMLTLQQEWLEKDLAGTNKRWKLVFIHRPVYHNRPAAGDEDLRDAFTPLFDRYHVDVVFAGHDHVYARSYPLTGSAWTGETGTGPVYITTGRSGKKTFGRAQPKSWNAVFYNPLEQPNYLTVAVSDHSLLIKAFKVNGEVIDTWGKAASAP